MLAVGRVYEFALPDWLQAGLLHQAAHLVAPDLQAAVGQCRDKPAAAVTLAAAHERGTQMHARFAKHRRSCTTLGLVKSSPANTKETTGLCEVVRIFWTHLTAASLASFVSVFAYQSCCLHRTLPLVL